MATSQSTCRVNQCLRIRSTGENGKSDHAEHRNAKDRTQADGRVESNDQSGAAHSASGRARTDQAMSCRLEVMLRIRTASARWGAHRRGSAPPVQFPTEKRAKTVMDHS